jgi:hypothetical protein
VGDPEDIAFIYLHIYDDVPAGVDLSYSHPDNVVKWYAWADQFPEENNFEYTFEQEPPSEQDFLIPDTPIHDIYLDDHWNYWKITCRSFEEPFIQEQDTIYWLSVTVWPDDPMTQTPGWKTSQDHWNDKAVWFDEIPAGGRWRELTDPVTGQPLDMAFVIAPEPATLSLVGISVLCLLRRRRS